MGNRIHLKTIESFYREKFGVEITDEKLKQIEGEAISASYLTAIVRGVNAILDLGRSIGTAIRRIQTGNLC